MVENFGAEEEFEFPEPIGRKKTYYFAQDEAGTIPLYIKTKKSSIFSIIYVYINAIRNFIIFT
jgi:saccharopine dehydrogenase-like NADP-dependent oxidoreductase